MELRFAEKHLTVYSNINSNENIKGDYALLRELFFNLVDNAIKYTPESGEITIGLTRTDGYAVVSIKDSGIGIAGDRLSRIFEPFYRIDKSRKDGMGLGLSICKRIIELHGGKIEVESLVGKGSEFIVWLPIN
jgi:two-component system phosphate regulon sensor histidine kinase PhoR